MPNTFQQLVVPFDYAAPAIFDADVLLYRGKSLFSKAIQAADHSRYSHAAMAGWVNGHEDPSTDLLCYEVRQWTGGRITTLAWQAATYPKQIDVYRLSDSYTAFLWDSAKKQQYGQTAVLKRKEAVHRMRQLAKPGEYGWHNLFWVSLFHLPLLRWFMPTIDNDQLVLKRPPFCSQAVANAVRTAFTDLVRHTPDCMTGPGDLGRSPLLHYMFTLDSPRDKEIPVCVASPCSSDAF